MLVGGVSEESEWRAVKNRGSSVVIENNKVALIKRVRAGQEYYVFPGGGIEQDESPEQAAIRETFEELGVHVAIKGSLGIVNYNGVQYFLLLRLLVERSEQGKVKSLGMNVGIGAPMSQYGSNWNNYHHWMFIRLRLQKKYIFYIEYRD